jgi:hypothetical protein
MRTEEEVRTLYKDYVYRHAKSSLDGKVIAAHEYFGAAIALGRTLGKDVRRITTDIDIVKTYIKSQSQ